jgi:hydroxymethylpyrimidine kinase/phosphomethylpyrimidine kinase
VKAVSHPIALTIAGSDSGGGAGIQADLNTFAALGVHGTSAITCLTAQNPRAVLGIQPASPAFLDLQLQALFAELRPAAVKTGMLFSSRLIQVVIDRLMRERSLPVVVDPVMVAASGGRLLQPAAIRILRQKLLPRATIVTPNLPEAELLLDHPIGDLDALRQACHEIHSAYGCAALVKGGHLDRTNEAVDFYYDGREELMLSAPRMRGVTTHGTGCTYAAAITACLALGYTLPKAVTRAKQFITTAIHQSVRIGRHHALHWTSASQIP